MNQQSQGHHLNNNYPENQGQQNQIKKLQMTNINQQKIQYPSPFYNLSQVYMIRKQSLSNSNDLIVKRLSKCFKKIKITKMTGRQKELYREYEQETSSIRRTFRRVHDLFKLGSKTPEITQKKIDKMKNRIQKVKNEVHKDEMFIARDLDMSKVYIRPMHIQPTSSQKNIQK